MNRRPWPIVIIAMLYALAPIPNVLLSSAIEGRSVEEHLIGFMTNGDWLDLVLHLFLFPTTAVAVYLCKKWSYSFFLFASAVVIASNIDYAIAFPDLYSIGLIISVHTINIAIVSYFLIPAVRQMYFKPSLRWWESKPRFLVNIRGALQCENEKANCRVIDISEGGAFVKCAENLDINDKVNLSFTFHNISMSLNANITYLRRMDGNGYGMHFTDLASNHAARKNLLHLIRSLKLLGVPRKRVLKNWREDFKDWMLKLFKTGEGFIPKTEYSMNTGALLLPKNKTEIKPTKKRDNDDTDPDIQIPVDEKNWKKSA